MSSQDIICDIMIAIYWNKNWLRGNAMENKNVRMIRLLISILSIGIMVTMISPVSADLFDTMNASVDVYNNNVDQVPGIVKYLVGNEETYITIDMNNGDKLEVKMVMKEGKILQFEKIIGFDESATVKVATTEKDVMELMTSNDPIDTFMKAMDKGSIKIEGAGIVMYAVMKSLGILMGISKLIGSLIGVIRSIF